MNATRSQLTRRGFIQRSGFAAAAILGGTAFISACGGDNNTAAAGGGKGSSAVKSLRLQLNWLPDYGFLGEVVALSKGFYDDAGIQVKIQPGGPSISETQLLGAGAADLSDGSSSAAMVARSAGVPLKAISTSSQSLPYAYFSLPRNPVKTPKDMIGKTVGLPNTGLPLLHALLAANGIDQSTVKTVTVGNDFSVLASGRVDVMTGYYTSLQAQQAALGNDYLTMKLSDCGVRLYAYMYSTTDSLLQSSSDSLQKLVIGSAKGWDYARKNPDEAVDLLVKFNPANKKEPQLESTKLLEPLIWGADTKEHGWGYMSREKWQEQLDLYAKIGQFKNGSTPSVDEIFTPKILEATTSERPKG